MVLTRQQRSRIRENMGKIKGNGLELEFLYRAERATKALAMPKRPDPKLARRGLVEEALIELIAICELMLEKNK